MRKIITELRIRKPKSGIQFSPFNIQHISLKLFILFFTFHTSLFVLHSSAQENNIIRLDSTPAKIAKIPSKLFFINVGGGMSQLYNKDIYKSDLWQTKDGFGSRVDIGLSWLIKSTKKKLIQVFWGFGLGLSSSSGTISFSNYNAVYSETDRERDAYKNNVSYNSVNEKTNIMMLEIPVFLEFGSKNHKAISYYLKVGLAPSIPVTSAFTGEGTYSSIGNYHNSEYNINYSLDDLPQYGFVSDKAIYQNTPKSTLSSFDVNGLVSIGFIFPMGTKSFLKIGVNGELGLMQLSKNNNNYDYTNYKYQMNVNNLFEDNKANTFNRFLGIEIGYIYNFGGWFYK